MIEILQSLTQGHSLNSEEAELLMDSVLTQQHKPEQMGALLMALHFLPPQGAALAGFAKALKRRALRVPETLPNLVDVCGTGGDGLGSFNVSTTVAFVVAGGGVPVAKHGNRAVSSLCGSFDVLEKLGVPFADTVQEATQDLLTFGLSFLYAPSFHPAFLKLSPLRKSLGFRTILNVLGPLINPTLVKRQLVGVYSPQLLRPMAEALRDLGCEKALVVYGKDGSDEISLSADTEALLLENGEIQSLLVRPEAFDLKKAPAQTFLGGSSEENKRILLSILTGELGPRRDLVLLNAAAAFYVADACSDLAEGLELAKSSLQSGQALKKLQQMQSSTGAQIFQPQRCL